MAETLPKLLRSVSENYPNEAAQRWKDSSGTFLTTSFASLFDEVRDFAAGLTLLGVSRGDLVGLISENRREWLIADLGILSIGAADVPRGCDVTEQEVSHIYGVTDCRVLILENEKQYPKVAQAKLTGLKFIILMDGNLAAADGVEVLDFAKVQADGAADRKLHPEIVDGEIEKGRRDDVATIIFTSGTTGMPKGVMLSHGNFLHQVTHVPDLIKIGPGDQWLNILPVWHSFERIMQYVALGWASALGYSKPIGKIMLADMAVLKPTWIPAVPRVWEALMTGILRNIRQTGGVTKALFFFFLSVGKAYSFFRNVLLRRRPRFRRRIRVFDPLFAVPLLVVLLPFKLLGDLLVFRKVKARLGGRFVAGISGGGALPPVVDKFYQAVGLTVLEGYGLTESAPVLSLRPQWHPVEGTIGPIFPGTEFKILDESGREVGPGVKGVLHCRGPQIMKGYFKQPDLTKTVIGEDGYLDTGDLAMCTLDGEIKIVGRAKDTIVLSGGENVEPDPIEKKLRESEYIANAVLLGQDRKFLAALIIPDFDALGSYAQANNIPFESIEDLCESPEVHELISSQGSSLVNSRTGFKSFERVARYHVLCKDFAVGKELSAKQEVKRHVVDEVYAKEIKALFS